MNNLMKLIDEYADARHLQGHSTYNTGTKAALDAVIAALEQQASPWHPASEPPKEEDAEVLVRMPDGRCEIAWATYWHGSSTGFAQWTFRDPDEDSTPVAWMHIPEGSAT